MFSRARYLIKLNLTLIREVFNVVFNENSQMAKSMVLLIVMGVITEEEVPDLGNLRDVVRQVLTK